MCLIFLLLLLPLALPAWPQAPYCGTYSLGQLPLPRAKGLVLEQAAQIEVGTQLQFPVSGNPLLLPATCRYVGEHAYIFVEDVQWDEEGGPIVQKDVDTLGELFDRSTPADPERGIYELGVEAFGQPPDVDGDPRVFILVLDISEPQIIGFFDRRVSTHEIPELRRDLLYIDEFAIRRQPYLARGTLAHEFQHLIHWGIDPDEDPWVDEGLAGYAEALAGYPEADSTVVPSFLKNPEAGLLWGFPAQAYHYGSTYLFAAFLAERYGRGLIHQLVAEPRNGTFGVDAAFASGNIDQDFVGTWGEWVVGNYASADPRYGYAALKGRQARAFSVALPLEETEGKVGRPWGATYISFPMAGDIEVGFRGTGRFRVWGYAWQGGRRELQEMVLDESGQGRLATEKVDSLAVIVGRTALQGDTFVLWAHRYIPTAVEEAAALPRRLRLGAGYPNPFNGYAVIPFELPDRAPVELRIYDALGQQVRVLEQGMRPAGFHAAVWDGKDEAGRAAGSGTYVVVLRAGGERLSRRLSLIK